MTTKYQFKLKNCSDDEIRAAAAAMQQHMPYEMRNALIEEILFQQMKDTVTVDATQDGRARSAVLKEITDKTGISELYEISFPGYDHE